MNENLERRSFFYDERQRELRFFPHDLQHAVKAAGAFDRNRS
ncbi:MAG: hypothetical protein ABIZ49_03430 [Opitutaceae bacterium]